MASMAEEGCGTQLCSNCKKEIPVLNFTIHEIHCKRNIGVCPICKESFPKLEMRKHQEQEHTQVFCRCSMKMDQGCLQEHMDFDCPLRPMACRHCQIELAFNKLQDHEDYCGARTEWCGRCNRNVLVRDLKAHPEDCGKQNQEDRAGKVKPRLNSEVDLHNIHTLRNPLHPPEEFAGLFPKRRQLPENRLYNCLSEGEFGRRNVAPSWADRNRAPLETLADPFPLEEDQDCDSDYLLALSLQQENGAPPSRAAEVIQSDFWKSTCPAPTNPSLDAKSPGVFSLASDVPNRAQTEVLLPCEFCEELYPEEDLILHQTGCNPQRALASFSKRSCFGSQTEQLWQLWEQLENRQPSGGRGSSPLPVADEGQGRLLLPCEFCGVQLEEEILFHHQDQCDLRPATAPSRGGTLPEESREKTDSPELPQRRLRHQGEISPQYLEEFQAPKPRQPMLGSPLQSNLEAARHTQLTSPNNQRENHGGPPFPWAKNLRGWTPNRDPSDPPAAAQHPPQTGYRPSFPGTVPTRPSLRTEQRRHSPTRVARYSPTKAKPWPGEPDGREDK